MTAHFPIALGLRGRRCVVVGGGNVARRKLDALVAGGAENVVVVAPAISAGIRAHASSPGIELRERRFMPADLDGAFLVMIATDDREQNAAIAAEARRRGALVNAADDPAHCDFILPAVVRRGDVQVAVTTAGRSPAVSRHLRERLDRWLAPEYGPLLDIIDNIRQSLQRAGESVDPEGWQQAISEEALDVLRSQDSEAAEDLIRARLGLEARGQVTGNRGQGTELIPSPLAGEGKGEGDELIPSPLAGEGKGEGAVGRIILVGAGPGDPNLITVAGREALGHADVIVYDRLVSPQLLGVAPPGARRIYAGKAPGRVGPLTQDEINTLLCSEAQAGKIVIRLKGGDPFVFGRGGEEMLAAIAAGVPVSVIPGVTAAVAVPESAGIPLTHRGVASMFTVLTGQQGPTAAAPIDWEALVRLGGTLVLLMGVETLPAIIGELLAAGLDPELPAAVIEQGTLPGQRTVTGPIREIVELAHRCGITSPATTVIGDVAALATQLGSASGGAES